MRSESTMRRMIVLRYLDGSDDRIERKGSIFSLR